MKHIVASILIGSLLSGCKEQSPKPSLPKESRLTRYEISGLKIGLPAPPLSKAMELPAQTRQMLESMETYEIDQGSTKTIVSHLVFKIPEVNLEGAADGGIAQVKAQPGVTDFKSSKEDVVVSGLPGRKISVTMKSSGNPVSQHSLVFSRKNELWQIQVIGVGNVNQKSLENLKEKVFGSVELQ